MIILKLVRERVSKVEERIDELERCEKLHALAIGNLSEKLQSSCDQVARLIHRLDNKKADK